MSLEGEQKPSLFCANRVLAVWILIEWLFYAKIKCNGYQSSTEFKECQIAFGSKNMTHTHLNEVWARCHPHLQPLSQEQTFTHNERQSCSVCGEHQAIPIVAHLKYGEDWHYNQLLSYCYHCQNYSLPETTGLDNQPLTAVDARLWYAEPVVLHMELTTRCNFNCWYCRGRTLEQTDITRENFLRVLSHFPSIKTLILMGDGESILHKDFFYMVKTASERNIHVTTGSNGSVLSKSVIKKLCESGLTYVSISIDSPDPATFAASRLGGDLEKIWQNIENLTKYRDTHGYQYPLVGIKGTLLESDKHQMPTLIKEAKARGVDLLESFQTLNPMHTYAQFYPTDKLELLSEIPQVQQAIHFGQQQSGLTHSEQLPEAAEVSIRENVCVSDIGTPNGIGKNCDREWIRAVISGEVTPCCHIRTPMTQKVNIFNHTLQEIISDQEYENVKFNLWNGIFLNECQGCMDRNL